MESSLQVQTKIRRIDVVAFNLFILPRARGNWIFLGVVTVGIFIFILARQPSISFPDVGFALISSLIGGVAALILGFLSSMIFILLSSSIKSGVLGPHTYSIDQEGLREVTPVNEGLQKWLGVQEVGRSKRFLFIRINGYLFHLIPRHAFSSDEEFNAFGTAAYNFWKSAA